MSLAESRPLPLDHPFAARPSLLRDLLGNTRVVAGAATILILALIAVLAPVLAPFDPTAQVLLDRLQGPGLEHLFGTDALGRDVLSRCIWGARVSLSIGLVAMLITVAVGSVVGVVAGYLGGWVDRLLMRITDVFLSIPVFLLLITVVTIYGSGLVLLVLFIGLTAWPGTARIVRAEVLSLRSREFIESAIVVGVRSQRIMARHILPNVVPIIVVAATLRVGAVILTEAGLSFFGLGVQPPTPTWGNIVADGQPVLNIAWWISTVPGVLIMTTVLAFNFVGDGLRDVVDPRRRGIQ